ncbi:hypothetical protein AAY24_13840 [Sedimenticola thiotaurini]|uniref:Uncharacterized protein n=1 Tax=Sedimenticola thiotaurini TaxID=1543721 RepID=A0A0F7K0Z5_9GAMM|nr:hypothetical protein AAY24_13840 [Sedimenticola thiotaurini]
MAQLLKISPEQAGHLIQGDRFRIKKALEKSKAEHLLEKVRARGAECSIEPIGPPVRAATPSPEKSPPESAAATTDEPLSLDLPEPVMDPEATRPLTAVQPQGVKKIVLEEGERAAYRPDDDSANVGVFLERSTAVKRDDPEQEEAQRKKRLLWIGAGIVALLIVGLVLVLPMLTAEPEEPALATTPVKPVDPQLAQTNRRLGQLNRSIKVWMIQYGSGFNPAQVTLDRLQQDLGIGEQDMLDGWGTALRFEPGEESYQVSSAGPDKVFGSKDDLVRKTSVKDGLR